MSDRITIVGSGVVGAASGRGFLRHGHDVTLVDISPSRRRALAAEGLSTAEQVELGAHDRWVFLTLPTPHDGRGWNLQPFTEGVRAVGEAIGRSSGYHTVVVRSTVPPGTCDGLVAPVLEEASGRRLGPGFALASNPEFLRARSADEDFLHPWMTVIASRSRRTQERLAELLAPFGGELQRFDEPAVAELIKCSHNLFNAAKISFWNELWLVARRLDLDIAEVSRTVARSAEASFNATYGTSAGAPYDGACLPKDAKGFLGFADGIGVPMPLLEAVEAVNEHVRAVTGRAPGTLPRPRIPVTMDGKAKDRSDAS
jgi:UDPglucose 6-dehydrogenase